MQTPGIQINEYLETCGRKYQCSKLSVAQNQHQTQAKQKNVYKTD